MTQCQQNRRFRLPIALLLMAVVVLPKFADAEPTKLPAFGNIRRAVEEHLAELRDKPAGDILTRGNIQPLFATFKELGWEASEEQELLSRLLSDSDPLVTLLRGPAGVKMM